MIIETINIIIDDSNCGPENEGEPEPNVECDRELNEYGEPSDLRQAVDSVSRSIAKKDET